MGNSVRERRGGAGDAAAVVSGRGVAAGMHLTRMDTRGTGVGGIARERVWGGASVVRTHGAVASGRGGKERREEEDLRGG